MLNDNLVVAGLLVRLFTGLLFMFQGYDKLFRIKIPGVIDAFKSDAQSNNIPPPLVSGLAYFTSYVEFLAGFFLIFGFLTDYALYALGLDLILVAIAFSYLEPMWDMKHVFPRLVLVVILLVLPGSWQELSLDHFLSPAGSK